MVFLRAFAALSIILGVAACEPSTPKDEAFLENYGYREGDR